MSCYFSVLLHFCYFYKLDTIGTLNNFFCNNLGLITRLTHAAGPLQPFPRHFLRSDIELELQIVEMIQLLDLTLSYFHVLGQQESPVEPPTSTQPVTPLSRQAILNVECDTLATEALRVAHPSPLVTFIPASKVSVTIDGTTVTRTIPRTIRTLIG
jgi:hypothetical protein